MANGDSSSPAVVGGRLYVTYPDNYYAFDRLTGASDWVTALGGDGGGGATPVVADGHVYVRDWASSGRILSAADGSTHGPMASGAALAVTGGVAYEMVGETLEAVAGDGLGTASWSFAGDGDLDTTPVVFGGMVVVGPSNGALHGLDPATGAVDWTTTTGQPIAGGFSESWQPFSGLGTGGGTLFVPAGAVLHAYAPATGPGAPVNRVVPSVDGVAQAAEQLAADVGIWTRGPTAYDYQWQRCDADGGSCAPIFGAVGSAYTAADANLGGTLRVSVAATNALGDGPAVVSAPTAAIPPARPHSLTPPSILGTPQDGRSLQASTGTWSGSPTSYGYQWARSERSNSGRPYVRFVADRRDASGRRRPAATVGLLSG